MPPEFSRFSAMGIAALVMLLVYRRIRRNFGRQTLQPKRMMLRMAVLLVIAVLLAPLAAKSPAYLGAILAGIVAGVGLALWAAARLRFERIDGQLFYLPHTVSGVVITVVVLGRVAYRAAQMVWWPEDLASPASGGSMVRSPATAGLLFALIGYYVCYYSCVLWKSKHLGEDYLAKTTNAIVSNPKENSKVL
jgi:hypothetical protein